MKKYILLLLAIFISTIVESYGQQLTSTNGKHHAYPTGSISYTMGEAITSTLTDGTTVLTQGFQQSNLAVQTTIAPVLACQNNVVVPILIHNISNLANFKLSLGFNSNELNYITYQNENAALAGGTLEAQASGDEIQINWTSASAVNLSSPTLIELVFTAESSVAASDLVWNTSENKCQYKDLNNNIFPAQFTGTTLVIQELMTANAGESVTICENELSYKIVDAEAQSYNTLLWTGGLGTISDETSISPTYVPAPMERDTVVLTLIATPLTPCSSNAVSKKIIVIHSNPSQSGEIGDDQLICFGTTPDKLKSKTEASGQIGTIEYKWQSSTQSATSGYSDIISSNAAEYSPGILTDTTWYKRLARVDCLTDWTSALESNVIEIAVRKDFTPGAIETTSETICYNGVPATIGNSIAANGGDENIVYKWESSTDGFASTSTIIVGATAETYSPPAGITATTSYRRYANDGTCNTTFETAVGTWTTTVLPPPVANCKDITIYLDVTGNASIDSSDINDGSTYACGLKSMTLDKSDFTCVNTGVNTIELKLADLNNNIDFCTAQVTIEDTILPTALCQDTTIYLDASGIAVIDSSFVNNGSFDVCGIHSITIDQTSFDCSNLGTNEVSLVVQDLSSNISICQSTITVKDTLAPQINCRAINVQLERNGEYTLDNEDIVNLTRHSTDNTTCEKLQFMVTPNTFYCDDVGAVEVTVTATDQAGNQSECITTVNVKNSYPIQLIPIQDIEISLTEGKCETKINYPGIYALRPCVSLTQLEGLGSDGIFPIGITTEVWEATNTSGMNETISFNVIVIPQESKPSIDNLANVETNEDTPVTVNLTGIFVENTCANPELAFSLTGANSDLISNVNIDYNQGDSTGILTITPAPNISGTVDLTMVLNDINGGEIARTFTFTIHPVNDPPVLTQRVINQSVDANDTVNFSLSKLMGVLFNDIDDSSLEYSVQFEGAAMPNWVTASDSADTFTLHFTPLQADVGCYNLIVTAVDASGESASDTFEVCVQQLLVGINDLVNDIYETSMFPNPTKGLVTIKTNILTDKDIEVAVMNIAGAEVFRQMYRGSEVIQLDLSKQISGIYMVLINVDGHHREAKKLILDRK